MSKFHRGDARHLVMRAGLGFVLGWFGVNELRAPSEWSLFVPSFVSSHSPLAVNDLVLLHGFLLLVAGAFVVLGVLYFVGCVLALGLVSEIVFGLWLDGGISDLVIRDLGLLGFAAALTLDPVRFWHAESMLPRLLPGHRAAHPGGKGRGVPLSQRQGWLVQAGGASVLVVGVIGLALLLHATGGSVSGPAGGSIASSTTGSEQSGPGQGSGGGAGATATPAPSSGTATTIRFDSWQYKQFAFQVYPGDISSEAKRALAGFTFSAQDQGDKVLLLLKARSPGYKDSQMYMQKGDTAYFVETSMRDDPNDLENNLRDDGVVVVNPQGYIIQPSTSG
jgi:hypothetical protein